MMNILLPIGRAILRAAQCICLLSACALAHAATINFSGQLDIVQDDLGGAVYSGVAVGSNFSGAIDDVAVTGFISDGATLTSFGCCIAAGGLSVSNDDVLSASDATLLNSLAGTSFAPGDLIDTINLEGDALTSGGGRIEIGLSFILDPLAFNDDNLSNYPPNPDDIQIALFFIAEFDDQEGEIYSALGELDDAPICEIELSEATYTDGETITASVFQLANPGPDPVTVDLKNWLAIPSISPISVLDLDDLTLPGGFDSDFGPIPLLPVDPSLPRGTYEYNCRMLDPVTGAERSFDQNAFEVQ